MINNPICRVCKEVLTNDNWYPSRQKKGYCICKECEKANTTIYNRKNGVRAFDENKECSLYLGVHINERAVRYVFDDVEVMPFGNPGYDYICGNGKKIDAKSSCLRKDGRWAFDIRRNTTSDYFLCVAYDNREDLNPLHIWLIPGDKVNHLTGVSIFTSTIHKWDEYELDIDKIGVRCDSMRSPQHKSAFAELMQKRKQDVNSKEQSQSVD